MKSAPAILLRSEQKFVEYVLWELCPRTAPYLRMAGLGRKLIAKNVRELRAAKGMSQEDLAGAAQIDRSYVSLIENEHFSISIDQIEKLADALGIAIHELLLADAAERLDGTNRK
jgi:DNA-binding XRE family transcriptional regulator